MKKFTVLGTNVAISKSPKLFNYIFTQLNIDAEYSFIEINNRAQFNSFLESKDLMNFSGINITMPYKSNIINYSDFQSENVACGPFSWLIGSEISIGNCWRDRWLQSRRRWQHCSISCVVPSASAAAIGYGMRSVASISWRRTYRCVRQCCARTQAIHCCNLHV